MLVDNYNAGSDPQVLTGSHNWSTSAETRNDENTLIIHDKIVTDQYFQAFAYLYNFAGGVLNATEFAQANHQFIAYPNPTADIAYIKSDNRTANQSGSYTIFNVSGNKILEKQFTQLKDNLSKRTILHQSKNRRQNLPNKTPQKIKQKSISREIDFFMNYPQLSQNIHFQFFKLIYFD